MVVKDRPITLQRIVERVENFPVAGVYAYQPKGRWPWLQRLCFGVLRHLCCEWMREDVEVEVVRVDYDRLDELMLELAEQHRTIRKVLDVHGGCILMGPEEFRQIVRSQPSLGLWEFDFQCSVTCDSQLRVIGLRAVVIPWMTGILLVPNRYLLKEREAEHAL